jgi:hypothetical protein
LLLLLRCSAPGPLRRLSMAADAAKQIKALRRLLATKGKLEDIDVKQVSDGLRSEALGVIEAAVDVCTARAGVECAAPLSHAWPRAPPTALPLMAAALVVAARDSGDAAMLLRLASSRHDGGSEIAAAVADELRLRPKSWAGLRPFAVNFLLNGSGVDAQLASVAVSDAYARVQLHEAAVRAASADPQSVRDVGLLPLCYAGGEAGDGWSWIGMALQQLQSATLGHGSETGDGARMLLQQLLPRLCLHHALELALAHRSAVPPLRLLGETLAGADQASLPAAVLRQLLLAAAHLLCLLPGVKERELLLKVLQQLCAAGTLQACEAPLLALLISAVLREQHSADGGGTAAKLEAERLLPSLVSAMSQAKPLTAEAVASMTQIVPLSAWVGRTHDLAAGLWRCWATLDGLVDGGSEATAASELEQWFHAAASAARHVGDSSQQAMVGVCSASLLLHSSAVARLVAIGMLRRASEQHSTPDGAAMTYLAVALHALQAGAAADPSPSGATAQVALLHLIPVTGALSSKAAQATFRFLKQLLFGGMNIDVCCTLLCTFWLARRESSGADEVMEALAGAVRSAAAATIPKSAEMEAHSAMVAAGRTHCLSCRTEVATADVCVVCGAPPAALGAPSGAVAAAPVAAGACLLRVCEAAPHEGLSFIATIMELLALGRSTGGSTAPMALECLATMAEAGELAPLPLLALLRTTFGVDPANSLSPQQAGGSSTAWATAIYGSGDGQSDAGGAALVRCLACVAEEYRLPIETADEEETDKQKSASTPELSSSDGVGDAVKEEYDAAVASVAAFEEVMAAFSDALQGGGGRFPVGRSRTRAQIFDAVTQFVRDGIEAECLAPLTQGTAAATLLQQEILSASSAAAAAGSRPGAKAEEDGVGGTWESAAACEAYVVAILEVQALSCWRSV